MSERWIILSKAKNAEQANVLHFRDARRRRRHKSKHLAECARCCKRCLAATMVRPQGFVGSPTGCRNSGNTSTDLRAEFTQDGFPRQPGRVPGKAAKAACFRRKRSPRALKKHRICGVLVRPQGFVGSPTGCRNSGNTSNELRAEFTQDGFPRQPGRVPGKAAKSRLFP